MFEVAVEDVFSITGRGTIFAGEVRSGSISVGDEVVCKTPSKEIQTRVIGLEEIDTRKMLQVAHAGTRVAVYCKKIDHKHLQGATQGEGENARVVGPLTLVKGAKKRWWQF